MGLGSFLYFPLEFWAVASIFSFVEFSHDYRFARVSVASVVGHPTICFGSDSRFVHAILLKVI